MNFNVTFGYKKKTKLFDELEFNIDENKITVVCGHNGAGKTTLLKLVSGVLPSNLKNAKGWYVPASGGLIQHFSLREHLNILKEKQNEKTKILVDKAYELFSIKDFENSRISKLSTGQGMLAAIIVAIASNSDFILFDEPFGSLDPTNAENLSTLLKMLPKSGKTIIITSHDLFLTAETADNVIFIKNGQISWQSDNTKELDVEYLKEMYRLYA